MTIRLSKTPPNRPGSFLAERGVVDSRGDASRSLEDVHDGLVTLSRAHPFDFQDRLRIRVEKQGEEFGVPLPRRMENRSPEHYFVVRQSGPGSLWAARSALAENATLWFKSDAAVGTEFVIVPF